MRPRNFSVVAALTLLPAAMPVLAQERGTGGEFGIDVIYQDAQDIGFNGGSAVSLDADWGLAFNFGYRFNSRFEMQLALDWNEVDYDVTIVSDNPILQSFGLQGSLEAFTPRVIGNYNFMDGPLTPYVTAAIGWSFVDTNIPEGPAQGVCWWDPWWGYVCDTFQETRSIDDFVYDLGVGLRWDVSPGYSLRLAYEKHWVDWSSANSTPDLDQFKLGLSYRY